MVFVKNKKQFGFAGIIVLACCFLILLGGGGYFFLKGRGKTLPKETLVSPEEEVKKMAGEILIALKERKMTEVAGFISPQKNLRFSPYAFIKKEDVSLSAKEVKEAFLNQTKRHWGVYDGSGLPIDLTFFDYYQKFIFDKDFTQATQIGINKIIGQGNTLVNINEFYPGSFFIEYHLPGTEQYGGMDWASLILVFQKEGNKWFLVGIVHNQWTI